MVTLVVDEFVCLASALANWVDSGDVVAAFHAFDSDVMGALWHGVVEAQFVFTVSTSGNDTSSLEPGPWGANLTTIASE